jgi:uncharacterized protein with HEPN domain
MPLPDVDRVEHMIEAAREVTAAVQGRSRADLGAKDRLLRRALERLIEIIGEAAKGVTPAARAQATTIPWAKIARARDRIIHGYDSVDLDIVWEIVTKEIPILLASLEPLRALLLAPPTPPRTPGSSAPHASP